VEDRQGTLVLHPPETQDCLVLSCHWGSGLQAEPVLQRVIRQFPCSRQVRPVPVGTHPDVVDCQQGEARLGTPVHWWQNWFPFRTWQAWKLWAFGRSPVTVVASLLHAGSRDPDLEALVRMVLTHLELADAPADPPEEFERRALELSRQIFPELQVERLDDFHLRIGAARLNLENFYRAYVRAPEQFEDILLPAMHTAVQAQQWAEQGTLPPLELVRDRLMPMLYPEQLWREKFQDIPGEPWVAGLVILYVVDELQAYWFVREELIQNWGLKPDELHEIALENLRSHFERQPMEIASVMSEGVVMMPEKPDTYHSTRLICHDFVSNLRTAGQGDLVVGVPGRDFFVAVSADVPGVVQRLRTCIHNDYRQTDHPLTSRMLLITADGVSELVDTPME